MSAQQREDRTHDNRIHDNRIHDNRTHDNRVPDIEQSIGESEISYSAYLDDKHNMYTKKVRRLRAGRRSGHLEDFVVDSSSDNSTNLSDEQSDRSNNIPNDRSNNELNNEERDESTDSSDVSIVDIESDKNDIDIDLKSDMIRIVKLSSRPQDRAKNIRGRQTNSSEELYNGHSDSLLQIKSDQIKRHRSSSPKLSYCIGMKTRNYESDITSDDKGLLKEFGDSEVIGCSPPDFRPPLHLDQPKRTPDVRKRSHTRSRSQIPEQDMELALMEEIVKYENLLTSDEDSPKEKDGMDSLIMSDPELTLSLEDEMMAALQNELDKSISVMTHSKSETKNPVSQKKLKKKKMIDSTEARGSRRMIKWTNDEDVDTCYGCSELFSYLNRKHHCRLCGRIFCQTCSRYSTVLPMDILKNIPDRPNSYMDFVFGDELSSKVRVCGECFKYASDIIRIRKIIKVFEICGFNLIELKYLSTLNEDWKKAAEFCTERFREIQYKLSIEELSPADKKYIWVNRYLLSKHSRWMVLLFKSCDMSSESKVKELQQIVASKKKVSCWDIKCSRFCSSEIQLGDMLDIVKYNNNDPIISNYIIDCVSRIDGHTLMDYLPFLVTNAVNNIFMIDILLNKARNDFTLMTHVYWCIKAFVPDKMIRRNSIIQALRFIKDNTSQEFGDRFKIMIKNEKMNLKWIGLQNREITGKIVVPVCPDRDFTRIDVNNIKVMDSNSRPVIIPFEEGNSRKLIMYKEDDIRKDYVILGIINIIHNLLNSELNMDIDTVKYRVMPTSDNTGYIEIVENAQTIYDIIQNQTIQNYILNHNENTTVANIKDRFIKSTALYCVISYLFGFGDRHLENIMISETGLLFHIDFGYILGQDPKYTTNKSLRVTPEIINVIGGQNTDNYMRFSECCARIYTCLRRHVNLFSNLLSVVPLIDPQITEQKIMHEIFDRFEVGENNIEAATHMDLKVRRDSGSFDYMIIDFLHRSKNSSIMKGLTYVKNSIFGAVATYSNGST